MKKTLLFAILALLVNIASCQSPSETHGGTGQTISVNDFEKKLSTTPNAQLIDVRTPEEYAGGHLKNAVNINYNSGDFETQLGKLDKSKPVLVYCLSGGRSSKAANTMLEMGFAEVYNMDGGILKWNGAGKPTDHGPGGKPTGMDMDAFSKLVVQNKYVLVDYNAKWCEPCKKMLPVLESLADKKKEKLSLVKIDADENQEIMKAKGINRIPHLELYQDGKLIWQHDGLIEENELLKETKL